MANRWRLGGAGLAGVLAAVGAFLSGHDGGRNLPALPERSPEPVTDAEIAAEPEAQGKVRPSERWSESFGELLGRTVRNIGAQGTAMKERVEGFYGAYRLLRALGMSDAEIAGFIAGQARNKLERELNKNSLTAADMRKVMDGVQESVIRAAEDVDARMNLGGDFVRRVRDGVQATRAGREDALLGLEKGVAAGKEQLRKILREQNPTQDEE